LECERSRAPPPPPAPVPFSERPQDPVRSNMARLMLTGQRDETRTLRWLQVRLMLGTKLRRVDVGTEQSGRGPGPKSFWVNTPVVPWPPPSHGQYGWRSSCMKTRCRPQSAWAGDGLWQPLPGARRATEPSTTSCCATLSATPVCAHANRGCTPVVCRVARRICICIYRDDARLGPPLLCIWQGPVLTRRSCRVEAMEGATRELLEATECQADAPIMDGSAPQSTHSTYITHPIRHRQQTADSRPVSILCQHCRMPTAVTSHFASRRAGRATGTTAAKRVSSRSSNSFA
jgi:hypothetical protein